MNEVATLPPIDNLYEAMLTMPQAQLETLHYFADGMYLRWLFRPAGTLIVGKVHKREHFYLVIQGCVQIEKQVMKAPYLVISQPGTRRAVLALEDSVCITIHKTDKKDLAQIEEELVKTDERSPYLPGNILKPLELT
jgi:hypothetical protein